MGRRIRPAQHQRAGILNTTGDGLGSGICREEGDKPAPLPAACRFGADDGGARQAFS